MGFEDVAPRLVAALLRGAAIGHGAPVPAAFRCAHGVPMIRGLLLTGCLAGLVACARPAPPPEQPTHRCYEIPNGLAACDPINPEPAPAR
ncbi:hypothetical protein GXW78_04800 [Roseomonas terrae]|uniref:Lipoprotein n=1 Tax=Neoroseomonas terrae TaxID=424799 RepID=A0ABS5ED72_9PROT|nr:hypothetical protein [Neoroseomonas terrae]MBR0648970.1 hypothetical protein [Neoroseomonas terrae]